MHVFVGLSFFLTLFASAPPSTDALVIQRASERTRSLYYAMAKIRGLGLKASKKNSIECKIAPEEGSVVYCTAIDVNEDLGWTEGIEARWLFTIHEFGKPKLFFSQLRKVEQ